MLAEMSHAHLRIKFTFMLEDQQMDSNELDWEKEVQLKNYREIKKLNFISWQKRTLLYLLQHNTFRGQS